jgi:hypothetical protein
MLIIVCIIVALIIIVQLNNACVSGLKRSLRSFKLEGVTYPQVTDSGLGRLINITFSLENPSEFRIIIEQITVAISIDEEYAWGGGIPLEEPVSSGQKVFFSTSKSLSLIGERALESVQNPPYKLGVNGGITGSSQFLFLKSQESLPLVFFKKIVMGIP